MNEVPGRGGAMDVAGPMVSGGMLFSVSCSAARSGDPRKCVLAPRVE